MKPSRLKLEYEMRITEDFIPHRGTAEQGIAREEPLQKGMEEELKELVEKGAEIYAKA